jgi:DNA polymerase III epsilon subunit-like protein
MSLIRTAPTPKEKYELLKDDFNRLRDKYRALNDKYDRDIKKRNAEIHKGNYYINQLQHVSQRSKDTISGLQNELTNVHQKLKDARSLSEVRGKKLFGAEVDILSISEVGEKVTALNEEIFQAAATLGEALIHKRRGLFQTDLDHAAVAVSKEMVGEKLTNILITQAQKPESEAEINPLLIQVVLQVFMVNFCVSKIQSWYPGDPVVGDSLSAIYSQIRSNGKRCIDSKPSYV